MPKINFGQIKDNIKAAPGYVKQYWNNPKEGEYLTLKEMASYTATQAGSYIYLTASSMMTFSASYFCGSIMEISNLTFSTINIISTVIGYVLMFMNPISVLLYENHGRLTKKMRTFAHICYIGQIIVGLCCYFIPQNTFESIMPGAPQIVGNILVLSGFQNYLTWFIRRKLCAKYGRLKPFILLCGIPSAIIMSIIPFLPVQNLSSTNRVIVLHFVFTIMNYFHNSYIGVNGLVTFMTPNSQERQRLHSIVPIITGFAPSVINLFFPMLIQKTGGYLNLNTYKIFVPIFAFLGTLVSLSVIQVKERVIEAPIEKREKVTFFKGAKNCLKNKYLWIINISNILGQWQWLVGSLLGWWFVYSLRMEWFMGVAANIVVVGMTAGNIACPILTKKFEKRNILVTTRAITVITILGIALAVKMENIFIFLASLFLRNTIQPVVDGVSAGLGADVQDYHQWRFGERSDSTSGIFSWFLSPLNAAIGYIMPWILKGIGFTSDWDVLFDSAILNKVFSVYTWGTILGIICVTVPFLFYDLTKEKHDNCVEELKARLKAMEEEEDNGEELQENSEEDGKEVSEESESEVAQNA
jgi:GPH family glycoside/pentoside/hexuronide:cation symporter